MSPREDPSGGPQAQAQNVAAAIDLGSSSTHLIVAAVADDGRLTTLADESTFIALGDAVARDGRLGDTMRDAVLDALDRFVGRARELGAAGITIVGTEPIRMAADRTDLERAVRDRTGIRLDVLTHEEEALLMVIGVRAGRRVDRQLLVVDIGGGSTEFCLVGPSAAPQARGIKLGSAALTARHATSDPPRSDELRAMARDAALALEGAPDLGSATIVAVGGTASNLAKLVPDIAPDGSLSRAQLGAARATLATMSAGDAVARYLLKPVRARVLPAGAAIVEALFDRYQVDEIVVSDLGLREGAIQAVAHAGIDWRTRLAELAAGWRE